MRMLVLLLAFLALPASAADEPWALLKKGGYVVLLRHAQTTDGIGEDFRRFRVPLDEVLSSEWCRCVETAGLAFGGKAGSAVDLWPALNNLFGRPENRQKQIDELAERIGAWRGKGNLVLVTHGSTMLALTKVGVQMGEMLVLAPQGEGRFALVSRLSVR